MSAPTPRDPAPLCECGSEKSDPCHSLDPALLNTHTYDPADPTPVPPHLSDAERALWEKASKARDAQALALAHPYTTNHIAADRACGELEEACTPFRIHSLLTALSSERTDAALTIERLTDELIGAKRLAFEAAKQYDAVKAERDEARSALSSEREAGEEARKNAARWLFVRTKLDDGGTMYDPARQRRHCSLRLLTNIGAYFPSDSRVVTADEIVDAARAPSTETPR